MSLFPKSTSFYEVTPGSEWQCDDAPSPADESSGRHSLFFGLCAAGSDRLEVVAIYILAVVQSYPRRQTRPQTRDVVRPFPVEAEGIEQLLLDALY
jgi:hypothetical protein